MFSNHSLAFIHCRIRVILIKHESSSFSCLVWCQVSWQTKVSNSSFMISLSLSQYYCLPILIFLDHPSNIVFMITLVFHCAIHNTSPGFSVSLFVHHSGSVEVSRWCILFFVVRYCTFATACTLLRKSTLENLSGILMCTWFWQSIVWHLII